MTRLCGVTLSFECGLKMSNWFLLAILVGILLDTVWSGRVVVVGGKFGRGRLYDARLHSRIPVGKEHWNPASINYYENKDGAKIIKSSHFEQEYMLGRKITFFCEAQGLPRPQVTWFKDGIELYHHKYFQLHEWFVGNDTIKSKMEIDPATQKDAGFYQCQADNIYAIDSRAFRTDYALFNN